MARFSLLKTRGRAADAVPMPGPPREKHGHAAWGPSPTAWHRDRALAGQPVPIAKAAPLRSRTPPGQAIAPGLLARSSSCINLKLTFPLEREVHPD